MATEQRAAFSEDDLSAELEHLQHSQLPMFLIGAFVIGWIWFPYIMFNEWELGINATPTIVILLGASLAYEWRKKHYKLACWLVLLSSIVSMSLIIAAHPFSGAMAFGVLVIIMANALLGTRVALLTVVAMWIAGSMARGAATDVGEFSFLDTGEMLALYALVGGAIWLAARPLRASVECALSGWAQARDALKEARERRAELYRVVRALEEATYRIERMNEELIVARREAELARALKAKFVATVSHELRGPLNLILGFSRMMALSPEKYGEPLPATYHADIDAIYRNSQHLAALVDDILELSQIEAERLALVKDRIHLGEDVVKKAIEIMQPLAERKGLYLRQEVADELPWALADPVRLRQVLLNLLNNAIRFTDRGGITVHADRRDSRILVSIQDTGMGIADEDISRLFEAFRQLHTTEKQEERGSGLGLNICKQLVELHGGQIWAESKKGIGTTVYFTIPLPGTESIKADLVKTGEIQHRLATPKSCLVIHNDPALVRLLARYIEGYQIVGVPDERAALSAIEELHPRAILTTHEQLPGIKSQLGEMSYDVPIISWGMPSVTEMSESDGVISYLVKPISSEMLTAVLKQAEREDETKVLLVDDDPDTVRLLELMLTSIPRPYRILKAFDGFQALERMREVVPDIVIMDLLMPGLDGQETIARMRADDRLREVPVVIISARDRFEEGMILGTPISIHCRRPLEIVTGTRCLQTLLDLVSPCYLPEPVTSGSS